MPRLLLINVTRSVLSTGRIVDSIGHLAKEQGWDVCVVHGARYVGDSDLDHYQVTTYTNEVLHYLKSTLFDAQGLGSYYPTKRLIKFMGAYKPDVVHIHNIHGCYIHYPLLFDYLRNKRIQTIWTLHDCWPMTGHCVHFEKTRCVKWKTQCEKCPAIRDFPSSWIIDNSRKNYLRKKRLLADMANLQITTVSKWLYSVAQESFLKERPSRVIYNGVDTKVFKPTNSSVRDTLSVGNKILLLGLASSFDERKGIWDYVHLSKILPSKKYQILLVGGNDADMQKTANTNIIHLARTDDTKQLVEIYSASDILLSLSYEETFGLTIAEAMSCGTPSIVYNNTAQPELVTEQTGIVVETGNIEGIITAIQTIEKKGKKSYTANCRLRAEQCFDKAKRYAEYLQLYNSIL